MVLLHSIAVPGLT